MPKSLGIAVNAFTCRYLVVVVFFSASLPEVPLTPQYMNYSVLMTGAVVCSVVEYVYDRGKLREHYLSNYSGQLQWLRGRLELDWSGHYFLWKRRLYVD